MKKVLSVDEYDKRFSEIAARSDSEACLDFLHNYTCICGDPIPHGQSEVLKTNMPPRMPDNFEIKPI